MKEFFRQYKSGIVFAVVLGAMVALSIRLSLYIPDNVFDSFVSPILVVASTAVALSGAWTTFRHTDGLAFRKVWAWTLLVWGLADGAYIFLWIVSPKRVMDMGAYSLSTLEMLLGNILGWLLLLYPTYTIRPGWLNFKRAAWQLLPMFMLVALDYVIPLNLAPLLTLYPIALTVMLLSHVRAYNIWCKENYSTLDYIDSEWILRYLVMMVLIAFVYLFMCATHSHARGFTQLWLVIFMMVYSTEQIIFRKDPWTMLRYVEKEKAPETGSWSNAALRQKLDSWMESEKPYLNPDFQLADLGQVLAMNRTYLSQFIHAEYGCSFYQFVNSYRIEEAKKLKKENPRLKAQDISAMCGFSSPSVFTRTFTSITGMTPSEWSKSLPSD